MSFKSFLNKPFSNKITLIAILLALPVISACQQTPAENILNQETEINVATQAVTKTDIPSCLKEHNNPVNFVAIGDTGSGASFQYNVAKQMEAKYKDDPFPLVLMLGDNIYERGDIKKLGDQRFRLPYKNLLAQGIKFQPVLGNHDTIGGHGDEQIKFFNMPGRYYTCTQGNVQFFAINTGSFYKSVDQQNWLITHLAESPAKWTIVYGHYPIITSGQHRGTNAIDKTRATLLPILKRFQVDLYLAGHDHNYERFKPMDKETGKVLPIVSGGGGAWLRDIKERDAESVLYVKKHHFTYFEPGEASLKFTAIDTDGNIIDQGELKN